jgi:hypothetical protein
LYFDISGTTVQTRSQALFETNIVELDPEDGLGMKDQAKRINGWLMTGAIREDDNPEESNPKDDPYQPGGAIHREFNHFFDPYFDRPLTITGSQVLRWSYGQPIRKAVDWALGSADAFSDPDTRDTASTWNHFTLFDAHEAMFRALTLKQRTSPTAYTNLAATQTAAAAETTRKAYWATTFRALGDILHLNQDMAQPQHTRNEAHSGKRVLEYLGAGHTSVFEKYMDERARGVAVLLADGTATTLPPLPLDGYPTPAFERYTDFWSTNPGPNVASFGRGLADYSNVGFFTPVSNYGNANYPYPPAIAYATESVAGLLVTRPDVTTRFLRGDVQDRYTGSSTNIRLTTESVWNGRLTASGRPVRTYNLNRLNYDDMAALLIPRAVAYSAGILEHFFRGEMAVSLPDSGFYGVVDHARFAPSRSGSPTDVATGFKGFDKLKLKLRNTTPRLRTASGSYSDQPMSRGALVAVVRFHRNLCYDDLLAQWPQTSDDARACRSPIEEIVASDVIIDQSVPFATTSEPNGREFTFHFTDRELPINAWDVTLQVVYRGQLGTEGDAVAVATRDIAEPTFASFMNTTDYVVINGKFYRPEDVNAQQPLFTSIASSCRVFQPSGSYNVSPLCYNRTDSFTFTAGSSNVSIVAGGDTAIPPRRLARVALLPDRSSPAQFGWQVDGVTCWVFLTNPLQVRSYSAAIDANQSWNYGTPSTARSVRYWGLTVCYSDIAVTPTLPTSLDFSQLDDLAQNEIEPRPVTISGWD